VVDFGSHRKPPPDYRSRRQQLRLLLLIVGLGLVVILMNEARKPANWRWLTGQDQQRNAAAPPRTDIDNRLVPKRGDEVPGTFISPGPKAPERKSEQGEGYFPGVQPDYLASVKDDTVFRRDEYDAWFNLLGVLQDTKEASLEKASEGRVGYAQLFRQSKEFRGRLVTVRGTARRVVPLDAPKNGQGIEQYFQVWLQPDDNPSSPLVVYCLDLPEGFPRGTETSEEARITGFFFKRLAYMARDDARTAPTLLAKTLDWIRSPELPAEERLGVSQLPFIIGIAALLSGVAILYVYLRTRTDQHDHRQRPSGPDRGRDRDKQP
jgi:hypothetical protein